MDVRSRKLGMIAPEPGALKSCIWLHDYLSPTSPPPVETHWSAKAGPALEEALGNDRVGNCGICSPMHLIGVLMAAKAGVPGVGTTQEALDQYRSICGWRGIGEGPGCYTQSVLNHWRDRGIAVGGKVHRIDGWVAFDWTNADMWKFGIDLLGGAPIGVNLPSEWHASRDGDTWGVTNSGIDGGHAIPAIDYNAKGPVISTWGGTRQMTWEAATSRRWVTEAYLVLSPDWYGDDRLAPSGLDVDALKSDIGKIARGEAPDIAPTPPPWTWDQLA